ncbi:hypothetical protein NST84_09840 [Paenibacillus sp. FSL R7-0345]|uniref:hypothetical protein n=1 Tax=Paenibacillus sp. FSL R7-0345 TaxID=2954535 RepID=UPI00315A5803
MNKRKLIEIVKSRELPCTDGALRTYTGTRYRLIEVENTKSGVHNDYKENTY